MGCLQMKNGSCSVHKKTWHQGEGLIHASASKISPVGRCDASTRLKESTNEMPISGDPMDFFRFCLAGNVQGPSPPVLESQGVIMTCRPRIAVVAT